MSVIGKLFAFMAISLIRFYRYFISPLTRSSCRFTPTCSEYSIICIKNHGVITGGFLALKRILRCNPFGSFGLDPVPSKKDKNK